MESSLHWKETSQGTYEREIDGPEQFYVSASLNRSPVVNKGDWYVIAGVKLEGVRPSFISDAKNAWIATRSEYPTLSASIVAGKWRYKVADELELAEWLEETFHVHHSSLTGRQLMSKDVLVPAPRVTLHVLPNTKELVVQGPHTHLDGFGIMKVLQHIISCMALLPTESEAETSPVTCDGEVGILSLPMSLTCPIPPLSSDEREKWDNLFDGFVEPRNKIYLNTRNEGSAAGFSRTQWLVFDVESTKKLQSESRKLDVSLAALFQGSISLSTRLHGGSEEIATRHAIQGLFSARKYIDTSITTGAKLVSPLVVGVPLTYTLHENFHDLVKDANAAFEQGRKDGFGLKCGHLWASDLPRAFSAPLPTGKKVRAEGQMSYLGHVDSYLQEWTRSELNEGCAVHCVDFWLSLDILSANVVIEIFIFRDRINLSLAYNETFHSEQSMESYLQLVKKHLDEGLGIQTDASIRRPGQEEWISEGQYTL